MRLFARDHTYKHPWGNVTLAFWRKYPNKFSEHVKAVDTFARSYDARTGDYTAHRLVAAESALPSWVMAMGIDARAYALEQTTVNARTQKMVVRSQNLTGSSVIVVEEKCTYTPHAENAEWTQYHQEAHIRAFLPVVAGRLENYTFSSIAAKSAEGLQVIEQLCQNMVQGGPLAVLQQLWQQAAPAAAAPAAAAAADSKQ